ncbi:MAG: type II secretion system minor pseudopilin GspK [Burkholderiaceae bacterium]|nr:type II secretion system minor pseudopilin GspK [Burkholderiaceae bacterium]
MRRRAKPPQWGAALLMALITVALVATLAAAALWRQWRGIEVESAERTRVQSAWLLTGALDWARLLLLGDLVEDRQHGALVDHLGEPWAVPLAESRLSDFLSAGQSSGASDLERNAFLSGQITDLQSRLNVLNLAAPDADTQAAARARFTRLFQTLGLPISQLAALQRGLICAYAAMYPVTGSGTGSACGNPPLLPQRVEQLTWLGLDAATLTRLAPYIAVLPLPVTGGIVPVNLNTASNVVIYAALPGLQAAQAEQLVTLRQSTYFKSVDDAVQRGNLDTASVNTDWAAVNSSFFEVHGRLRLDDATLQEIAAVERAILPTQPTPIVFPLWRARSALTSGDLDAP